MQKTKMKKRCRDGVTCVVLFTLPSIYLVCVVFGTAIPTSFYNFWKMFFILVCIYMYVYTCTFCGLTKVQVCMTSFWNDVLRPKLVVFYASHTISL